MSAPFVSQLRTRTEPLRVDTGGMTVRVEMPEAWDAVRIDASPDTPVEAVKRAALSALWPDAQFDDDFVMKLRGFEILDEQESLSAAGATDGSIFLLTFRRRRPVR